jgi:hypothetical protein
MGTDDFGKGRLALEQKVTKGRKKNGGDLPTGGKSSSCICVIR